MKSREWCLLAPFPEDDKNILRRGKILFDNRYRFL